MRQPTGCLRSEFYTNLSLGQHGCCRKGLWVIAKQRKRELQRVSQARTPKASQARAPESLASGQASLGTQASPLSFRYERLYASLQPSLARRRNSRRPLQAFSSIASQLIACVLVCVHVCVLIVLICVIVTGGGLRSPE